MSMKKIAVASSSAVSLGQSRSWYSYFKYQEDRDSTTETRNVLLIVATLISAVTFSAGVNPPGGVWENDYGDHHAGRAIYATQKEPYYVFLFFNTTALSSSILVIMSLTVRFPFHLEIWVATFGMLVTYGSAIFAVSPEESVRFRYVLLAAALPFVVRLFIHLFNMLTHRYPDHQDDHQHNAGQI